MRTNEEQKGQKRFGGRAAAALAIAAVAVTLLMTQSGFLSRPAARGEASAKNETAGATASMPTGPTGGVVLAAPGRVEGQSEVIEVGASADGALIEVRVREGQQVMAGETLAVVACGDLEAERQAALAAVEIARQSRERLFRGSRDEERRIAANEVASAQAVLNQAESHYQRQSSLYETGDIARAQWEQARRDVDVAAAELRAAEARVALTNATALPEELARADAEIRAAENRAQAMAARAGKCLVRAPQAGRVLRVHLLPGERSASRRRVQSLAWLTRRGCACAPKLTNAIWDVCAPDSR